MPRAGRGAPRGGRGPRGPRRRKRQQLLNVALFVAPALRLNPRAKVVDFGAGGETTRACSPRAFPDASFCLRDLKRRSLEVASRRVEQAGLKNVRIVHGRIEDFREDFDVGLALHACGGASDAALFQCVAKKDPFFVRRRAVLRRENRDDESVHSGDEDDDYEHV